MARSDGVLAALLTAGPFLGGVAVTELAPSGCSVPPLDAIGKSCANSCPNGLSCIGGFCAQGASTSSVPDASIPPARDASTPTACPIKVSSSPGCSADGGPPISMFVGTQILDGLGNEFCNIDALPFDVAKGALPEPPEGGSNIDTRATIQVGWSNEGLHVFIHVTEATIRAPPTVVYNGDAVEVFAAATGEPTGIYGAHADPGLQVAVAPPLPSGTTGICAASSLTARGFTCQEWWASLRVDGGYNVEMQLPWDAFGAAVPSAGDRIALDFRCDIQGADGGLAFASSLWASPLSFDASACPKFGYPSLMTSCDDRTWCIYPLGAK